RVQLIDHRVDGLFQLQDLASNVHRDLLGKVSGGDGGGDLGDVAHLAGEVGGHRVDVVGEVLPGPGDAGHVRLAAQLALGADLACHARHLGGERAQLVHHGVDGLFQLQDLAANVHADLAAQVAVRHGDGDVGDVAHLGGEVV